MGEISSQAVGKPPRYGFIDLLRGFALVVMIETHVMNAYLPVALRKGSDFFFWLAFTNGLVAPAFLFATGFSLILQADRQWEDWLRFRPSFWRQMRRLGFITLVAYYSHLQGFRWSRYLENWNDQAFWARSLKADILQCIVVSLLAVMALMFILRRRNPLPWAAMALAVAAAVVTPWVWAQDFRETLPLSLALLLNPHGVSLFPVFPWVFFVLSGSSACCFFLRSVKRGLPAAFLRNAALGGAVLIAAGLLLRGAPYSLPGHVNFYTTSPLYMMIRLGCVLGICYLLYRLEAGQKWVPGLIRVAGQESLLVYGVHLWIIFAFLRGRLLAPWLGQQMGYAGCFALSAAIIVLMLYLAKYYHILKKKHPGRVRRIQAAIVLVMIAVFFLS